MPTDVLKQAVDYDALIDMLGCIVDQQSTIIKKLTERLSALEKRPEFKYAGVWKNDAVYGLGTFCTDGGSMWYARRANVGERPGACDAWQLSVKRGRDAAK